MTAMPQMVALFNGVGGGAVALISRRRVQGVARGRRQPGARGADPDPVRRDHRLDLVLGLERRVPQAPGDAEGPLRDPARGQRGARPDRDRARGRDRRRRRVAAPVLADPAHRRRARRVRRAADRRRRHAGRDLDPQRVHRPERGRRRHRARQHRADRGRHARRRLRLDPHAPDGGGDEPLDRQRVLLAGSARAARRSRARPAERFVPRARPTSPSSSPTPAS